MAEFTEKMSSMITSTVDGNYSVNSGIPENATEIGANWSWPYTDYPAIYTISIYHLYPTILFGRVIHVIWYTIGIIGNLVSLRLWMLPRMKRFNSSALYLVGITVCDISFQTLHVFYYLKYFWGLASLGYTGLCQIWNMLYYIPQYCSQLLVLGYTTERSIAIFQPFKGERFSRHQRAPKIVAGLVAFSVIAATPQAYFWNVNPFGFCELRLGQKVLTIHSAWSLASEILFFFIVPFVTLALNILVLRETYKSLSKHKALAEGKATTKDRIHRGKGQTCRPSTKTLLCISFFRILTQLPVTLTYTIQNWYQFGGEMPLDKMAYDPTWKQFIPYWGIRTIIDAIGASHHALIIFIFYYSTKQFRNELHNNIIAIKCAILRRPKKLPGFGPSTHSEVRFTDSIYRTTTTL